MEYKEIACNFEDGEAFTLLDGKRVKYRKCGPDGEKCVLCCLKDTGNGCDPCLTGADCEGGYFVDDDTEELSQVKKSVMALLERIEKLEKGK